MKIEKRINNNNIIYSVPLFFSLSLCIAKHEGKRVLCAVCVWVRFLRAFVFALCSLLTYKCKYANSLQHPGRGGGGGGAGIWYCAYLHF